MFTIVAEARTISVVVKLNHLFTPPKKHWKTRVQHDADHCFQTMRPTENRTNRCFRPIEGPNQFSHFSAITEEVKWFRVGSLCFDQHMICWSWSCSFKTLSQSKKVSGFVTNWVAPSSRVLARVVLSELVVNTIIGIAF